MDYIKVFQHTVGYERIINFFADVHYTLYNYILLLSLHQVAGVAARSLQTSSEFARKFNIPHAYGSYQELATQLDLGKGPFRNYTSSKLQLFRNIGMVHILLVCRRTHFQGPLTYFIDTL